MGKIQQTSVESYIGIVEDGIETTQLEMVQILFRYAKEPISDGDVSRALGIPKSTVSARRNSLVKAGYIRKAGWKKDPYTNKRVLTWEAVE